MRNPGKKYKYARGGQTIRSRDSGRSPAKDTEEHSAMLPLLALCVAGFVLFIGLAVWVSMGRGLRGAGLSDGKRVRYASVSDADAAASGSHDVSEAPVIRTPASDSEFVRVRDYAPDIRVDLKYAGKRNFTGKRIYTFSDAYLRYGTVKKLIKAQAALREYAVGLEIWDAYRPVYAQEKLWEVCPNPLYVTQPGKGYSDHTRGSAVDVTLVDSDGTELLMPTGLDNFTKLADRDYSDIDDDFARDNVRLLEHTMRSCGFTPYAEEWWHFSDTDVYEVDTSFVPPQ